MRVVAVGLLACVVAGCGDPSMDVMTPGSKAVVYNETATPGKGPALALELPTVEFWLPDSVNLDPGDRVAVINDPGFWDVDAAEIKLGIVVRKGVPEIEDMPREKPGRIYPPDRRASMRRVRVRVETGTHAGRSGWIRRRFIRPA